MQRGRYSNIGTAWAVAIALVLAFAIWPAIAEAPPSVIINPVAVCEHSKCVMSQKDYDALKKFHADRMASIISAGELIGKLQAENHELLRMLARDAAGCKGRRV